MTFNIVNYGYIYPNGIFHNRIVKRFDDKIIPLECDPKEDILNIPVTFDIETTSFERADLKYGTMYVWAVTVDTITYIGRTWEDFRIFLANLSHAYNLNENRKMLIYVHNLAFEFAFIRKQINFTKVFAINTRRPLYASTRFFEFRCSYLLSGLSLAKTAEEYCSKDNQKLVGDLDYSKIRHSKTPLFYNEICYLVQDTYTLAEYIKVMIEKWGDISRIPYTKTGEVRLLMRNKCLYKEKHRYNTQYKQLMDKLTMSPLLYVMTERAKTGGFTHASWFHVRKIIKDVESFDKSSSYPWSMCAEQYPMDSGKLVENLSPEDIDRLSQNYCCLFNIEFEDLEGVYHYEHFLSVSKVFNEHWKPLDRERIKRNIIDNGRIVSMKGKIRTTITEIDWKIIKKVYSWKNCKIGKCFVFKRGYLPKPIIEFILELYNNKTTLKGISEKLEIYMRDKQNLNSTYGMMITQIVHELFPFKNGEWIDVQKPNLNQALEQYNTNKKRFNYYLWGVYICKYSMFDLWKLIIEAGEDYLYSDTDSVKMMNAYKHLPFIERHNKQIIDKVKRCLDFYNIPIEKALPKTKKGVEKPLGVFERDGSYLKFKTLGAKRYFTEFIDEDGYLEFESTVAGCPKKDIPKYLKLMCNNNTDKMFEMFDDMLYIPKEYCSKNILAYNDKEFTLPIVDYLGNIYVASEKSSVNVSPNSFDMTLAEQFKIFLQGGYFYQL